MVGEAAAATYTVTLTASDSWSHPSESKVIIYDGYDKTGNIIFSEQPSAKTNFPTTITVESGTICIDLYVMNIYNAYVTSSDYTVSGSSTYGAVWNIPIDKNGTIDISVTDWDD